MSIFTLKGITVKLHLSFLIFIGIELFAAISKQNFTSMVYLFIAFASVTFHEFAHALTTKYYKYDVSCITLWPFGGLAHVDVPWDDAKKEFWIAINGPISSMFLCAIGIPICFLFPNQYTEFFINVNFFVAVFNMFPSYPLDGGRVLRSLLGTLFGIDPVVAAKITLIIAFVLFPFFTYGMYVTFDSFLMPVVYFFLLLSGVVEYKTIICKYAKEKATRIEQAEKLVNQSYNGVELDPIARERIIKSFYDFEEFSELALQYAGDRLRDLDTPYSELRSYLLRLTPYTLFLNEDKTYKNNHPCMDLFVEFFSVPSSRRKYIVKEIVDCELAAEFEILKERKKLLEST